MAFYFVTCWTFLVMFTFLRCFSATDISHSISIVEPKNISNSSSNVTSKILPEKDVPTLLTNTSEHSENDTSRATYSSGSVPRKLESGALLRGFYVIAGVGALIVIYVVVKTIRLKRIRSTTVRKYGVLASQEDLEMAPLDADDEEEDTTLFDASRHNQL